MTSHGRDSLVLLSADQYARLKVLDDRAAVYAHELPDNLGSDGRWRPSTKSWALGKYGRMKRVAMCLTEVHR